MSSDLFGESPEEAAQGGVSASLKIEEDGNIGGRKVEGYLFEDGGLADSALAVDDEDVIHELAGERAPNPIEDVLSAEEHGLLGDWGAGDVGVYHL
jgi:hypothetical protein